MSTEKPTEPGRYLDAFGNTWRLWNDGLFRMLGSSDADPDRYGPWQKLVVAEEPEWEYGVIGPTGRVVNNGDYTYLQTHRRRKVDWEPVPAVNTDNPPAYLEYALKQEGAGQ